MIVVRTFGYATIAIRIFRYDTYSILKYGAILGKGAQHTSWGRSPLDLLPLEYDLNSDAPPHTSKPSAHPQHISHILPNQPHPTAPDHTLQCQFPAPWPSQWWWHYGCAIVFSCGVFLIILVSFSISFHLSLLKVAIWYLLWVTSTFACWYNPASYTWKSLSGIIISLLHNPSLILSIWVSGAQYLPRASNCFIVCHASLGTITDSGIHIHHPPFMCLHSSFSISSTAITASMDTSAHPQRCCQLMYLTAQSRTSSSIVYSLTLTL